MVSLYVGSLQVPWLPPMSEDMHNSFISNFKLPVGVNASVCGCFSPYVCPVMNW